MHNYLTLFLLLSLSLITACSNDDENTTATSTGEGSIQGAFAVTGRMLTSGNTAKDNDVNDPKSPALSNNNSLETAQSIPNPVILGGYVNQPGAGPQGRSKQIGDINDVFVADLRTHQVIHLFVAQENLAGNDLDLALFNPQGQILNASVSEGATETLIVPRDGRYFIRVNAFLGGSNYILTIGQNTQVNNQSTANALVLSSEFTPYEMIARLHPDHVLQSQSLLSSLGLQTESPDSSRRMLLTLEPGNSRLLSTAEELIFATPELQSKYETLLAIKKLRHEDQFMEVSPNYILNKQSIPNDTFYPYQWNLSLMNMPQAWDMTTGDSSVVVAVVDTGVLLDHPDLQGKLVSGYDFIRNLRISLDGDGIDSSPNDPGDQSPNGSSFHGSHVAGIIAGRTNNRAGIAGIGWQTKVMPLRVLGKGGAGSDYDIEQAIRFAAGLANDAGFMPAQKADIINLSLGGPDISMGFQELIYEVRRAGVMVVAAAGNDGTGTLIYPASLDGVISVSGVDMNKQRVSYSNYGPLVDVAAPGGDNTPDINGDGMPDGILSTVGSEVTETNGKIKIEFTFSSSVGTSMASPHVAGVLALMKAAYPKLTPQIADSLIQSGSATEDLGPGGRDDQFGYGLMDARRAVLAAIEASGGQAAAPQPRLVVSPMSLNFGLSTQALTLNVNNGGGGDLQIENVTENSQGFLTIQGQGLGSYTVRIDRSQLGMGTFNATITIVSNSNTVNIPVILQVGDPNMTGDAGLHYILLVKPEPSEAWEVLQQVQTTARNGGYEYRFDGVQAGSYLVVAGTDFNNDGYICDVGEACGAYLVLRDPAPIQVNGNLRLSDFSTGFEVNFSAKSAYNLISDRAQAIPRLKRILEAE